MSELSIIPNTQAQKVREELSRITSQEQWSRDDYWKYFLKKRRIIFDSIYNNLEDKNWLNPAVTDCAEDEFRRRAPEHWGNPTEAWVLVGGWLTTRPDIVAWLRSTYWKHNQKRILVATAGREAIPRPDTGKIGATSWRDTVLQ